MPKGKSDRSYLFFGVTKKVGFRQMARDRYFGFLAWGNRNPFKVKTH